ncbi:MAG: Lrp/AsnC family transcriptional regulator [Elusimicrobia bacterium CG08_land_8_20_14_0_20_59_10]|nr:MAG: Lrp/AsnC family transcriptional regulator [Elusimicrobia bacterium CG08_land_8_20_14_0_20_59_10]
MNTEQAIIRALQGNIPLEPAPFKKLAAGLGLPEGKFLAGVKELKRRGILRSIRAIVRHRRAGYSANAMVAWKVTESRALSFGKTAAASPAVSHCYQRVTRPGWPYNLYTMVHGRSRAEMLKVVDGLAKKTGAKEYLVLESLREFKKTSMVYF